MAKKKKNRGSLEQIAAQVGRGVAETAASSKSLPEGLRVQARRDERKLEKQIQNYNNRPQRQEQRMPLTEHTFHIPRSGSDNRNPQTRTHSPRRDTTPISRRDVAAAPGTVDSKLAQNAKSRLNIHGSGNDDKIAMSRREFAEQQREEKEKKRKSGDKWEQAANLSAGERAGLTAKYTGEDLLANWRAGVASISTNEDKWKSAKDGEVVNITDETKKDTHMESAKELRGKARKDEIAAKNGLGAIGRFAVDAENVVLGLAGDAAVGAMTGTGPVGSLSSMFARSYGGSYLSAKEEGATDDQAMAYGVANGALEVATEKMFGVGKVFNRTFGAGFGDEIINNAANRAAKKLASRATKQGTKDLIHHGMSYFSSAITEGLEEVAADIADPFIANAIYATATGNPHSFDPADTGRNFLLGALLGGLGGGITEANNYKTGKQIKNVLGPDGLLEMADFVSNSDESGGRADAGAAIGMMVRNGEDISNAQAIEMYKAAEEQERRNFKRHTAAITAANKKIAQDDLVMPVTLQEDENGDLFPMLRDNTNRMYGAAKEQAMQELGRLSERDPSEDDVIAMSIANVRTGTGYSDDIEKIIASPEARAVYESTTGDILPAKREDMREHLEEVMAENRYQSAVAETAYLQEEKIGLMMQTETGELGAQGQAAYEVALDDAVEAGSNLDDSTLTAARTTFDDYYKAGSLGLSYGAVGAVQKPEYAIMSEKMKRRAYEAGIADNSVGTALNGRAVKRGEDISEAVSKAQEEGAAARGKLAIGVDDELRRYVTAKEQRVYRQMAQEFGVDIQLLDAAHFREAMKQIGAENIPESDEALPNGMYQNGIIYINIETPDRAIRYVVAHEFTHYLQQIAPKEYLELRNLLVSKLSEDDQRTLSNTIKRKKRQIGDLSDQDVLDEIIADSTYEFLNDQNFINEVVNGHQDLAQRILQAIKSAIAKLRAVLQHESQYAPSQNRDLWATLDALTDAEELWYNAIVTARENAVGSSVVRDQGDIHFSKKELQDMDAEYMDAVERGDMDKAQEMVDRYATEVMGFATAAAHGTLENFTKFRTISSAEPGAHFGTEQAAKELLSGRAHTKRARINKFFLDLGNSIEMPDIFGSAYAVHDYVTYINEAPVHNHENPYSSEAFDLQEEWEEDNPMVIRWKSYENPFNTKEQLPENADFAKIRELATQLKDEVENRRDITVDGKDFGKATQEYLEGLGYDSITYENEMEDAGSTSYIIFDPARIKSSDPVTYDNKGNVIPLSKRFDRKKKDVRYSSKDLDEEYMDALAAGDNATAWRLVEEAAHRAGYVTAAWHGRAGREYTVYDRDEIVSGDGFWFSASEGTARHYSHEFINGKDDVDSVFLDLGDSFVYDAEFNSWAEIPSEDRAYLDIVGIDVSMEKGSQGKNKYTITIDREDVGEDVHNLEMTPSELKQWVEDNITGFDEDEILHIARDIVDETESSGSFSADNDRLWDDYWYESGGFSSGTTTNQISEDAYREGYDSATILNVYDGGNADTVYVVFNSNQIKSADLETFDDAGNIIPLSKRFDRTNPDVRYSKRDAFETELSQGYESGDANIVRFSLREGPPPKNTKGKLYKLFKLYPDGSLGALFIDKGERLKIGGSWYDADSPSIKDLENLEAGHTYFVDRNGNAEVKEFATKNPGKADVEEATRQGGRLMLVDTYKDGSRKYHNWGINGSGAVASFALRPGWHTTDAPSARHIGAGKNGAESIWRREDEVWAEISIPADIDYQEEASQNPGGDIQTHIPTDGYYHFKTNTNAADDQQWYISGAIRIDRILSDEEAKQIAIEKGVREDLPRKSGRMFDPADIVRLSEKDSVGRTLTPGQQEYFAESRARDDQGRLIPVFHYTDAEIEEFDPDMRGSSTFASNTAFGTFVTPVEAFSKRFGANKNEMYALIKNPITFPMNAAKKYSPEECDEITRKWLEVTGNTELLDNLMEYAQDESEDGTIEPGALHEQWENVYVFDDDPDLEWDAEAVQDAGYDGVEIIEGFEDELTEDGSGDEGNVVVSYAIPDSSHLKLVTNENPTDDPRIRYSEKDAAGRDLSNGQEVYFKRSKIRDVLGRLLPMFHGTMDYGFTVWDRSKAHVGGNSGAGHYFTNNRLDAEDNYKDKEGADNYFKRTALASRIYEAGEWNGEDVLDYDQAYEIATEELDVNPGLYEVYLNVTNPYIRDFDNSTRLYDYLIEDFDESVVDRDEYEDEDDYYDALSEAEGDHVYKKIHSAVYGAMDTLEYTFGEIEMLGTYAEIVNDIYGEAMGYNRLNWSDLEQIIQDHEISVIMEFDEEGLVDATTEITRAIIEELGFDGIIDKEVSTKFNQVRNMTEHSLKHMDASDTVHVICFSSEQVKLVTNLNPTANRDIRFNKKTEYDPMVKPASPMAGTGKIKTVKKKPMLASGRELRAREMLLNIDRDNLNDEQIREMEDKVNEQIGAINDFFDEMVDFIENDLGVKYRFIGLDDVHKATVKVRWENGEPVSIVMSAMLKNGEYPVNFDLSAICKKRETMMEIVRALSITPADTGKSVFNSVEMNDERMWKINNVLREEGFETACLGCFVEARRYNSHKFYAKVEDLWNANVREARKKLGLPEEEWFNFSDSSKEITQVSMQDMNSVAKVWENYESTKAEKNSPAKRVKLLFDTIVKNGDVDSPYLRLIAPSDVLTPEGIEGLKKLSTADHDLVKMIKNFYGTAAPKEIQGFTPYNSEIIMLPQRKGDQSIEEYLMSIGGVRIQSFSDFKIENFFDYMQMIADMAARKFPGHAYAKEIAFAKIFGKTGLKINMSVLFDIDNDFCEQYGRQYAGLRFIDKGDLDESKYFTDVKQPYEDRKGKRYAKAHTLSDGREGYLVYLVGDRARSDEIYEENLKRNLENGMPEEQAKRLANMSRPFTQSINMDEAVELQNRPGYSENCGIIAVAYSDEHMKMLLEDPEIRYVIPYHKSGLPTFVSQHSGMGYAKDFTDTQNTNKRSSITKPNGKKYDWKKELNSIQKNKDIENPYIELFKRMREEEVEYKFGKKTTSQSKALAGTNGFDVYESLHRTKDPKKVANEYIKHCMDKKLVPIFPEYAGFDGYYKVLFDFSITDGHGVYEQRAVTNTYPGADDTTIDVSEPGADLGELKGIIDEAGAEQNNLVAERRERMGRVMDRLLNPESEDYLLAGSNVHALKYDEIDYSNPKYDAAEIDPNFAGDEETISAIYDSAPRMSRKETAPAGDNGQAETVDIDAVMPSMEEIYDYIDDHQEEFDIPIGEDEWTRDYAAHRTENVEQLRAQVDKLKKTKGLTHGQVLDEKSVKEPMNQLVMALLQSSEEGRGKRKTDHKMVKQCVDNAVNLFRDYQRGDTEAMVINALNLAEDLVSQLEFINDDMAQFYPDVRKTLLHTTIHVPEEVRSEIADFKDFRKSLLGLMRLSNEQGQEIDVLYEEIAEENPGLLATEFTHPVDQLLELATLAEAMRPFDVYLSSEEASALAFQTAMDLIDITIRGKAYKSIADKYKDKLRAAEQRYKEAERKLEREQREHWQTIEQLEGEKIAGEIDRQKQARLYKDAERELKKQQNKYEGQLERQQNKYERQIDKEKAKHWETVERLEGEKIAGAIEKQKQARHYQSRLDRQRAAFWQRWKKADEKRKAERQEEKQKRAAAQERAKHMKRLQKNYKWLVDRLVKPTDDKHIPPKFRQALANLLCQLDFQTEGSKRLEEKYGKVSNATFAMWDLRQQLSQIASEENNGPFENDGYVLTLMDAMINKMKGKSGDDLVRAIRDLSDQELADIDIILANIQHNVNNVNKAFTDSIAQNISDLAGSMLNRCADRIRKFGRYKEKQNFLKGLDALLNQSMVTPRDFFERIGGGIGECYKAIRKGQDKHIRNMDVFRKSMARILAGYGKKGRPGSEVEKWRGTKSVKSFELERGGTIELSVAQVMSLYCSIQRPQAAGHIIQGGIVPTEVTDDSLKTFLIGKSKAVQTGTSRVTYNDVRNIISSLTPEQAKMADRLMDFLNTTCAEWGNEASEALYGYDKFTEEHYFPIKSSDQYLDTNFEGRDTKERIKNFGFTKGTVVNASNPIVIDDIFSVVANHANKMSMYNAFACPISDFTRVYNYKEADPEADDDIRTVAVKEAIAATFGKRADKYIRDFMADLQNQENPRSDPLNVAFNKLLANYKKATIGFNARVALQQPTAIIRAFALINPKYFLGLKSLNVKANMREMKEHCPIALWKSWGFNQIDLANSMEDIMMNKEWSREDLLTMQIYGALDNMTWSVIWAAVKNEVKDKNPKIEVGSREFWELCNERASEVFDKTQVVDSPLHRSSVMRNKDTMTKILVSFMAEPTRTFNMVRSEIMDAIELWKLGDRAAAAEKLTRITTVFLLNAFVCGAAAAVADVMRGKDLDGDGDDDDYFEIVLHNFLDNANPILMLPFFKDAWGFLENAGKPWMRGTSNMGLEGISSLMEAIYKMHKDGFNRKTLRGVVEGIGLVTGKPIKNVLREVETLTGIDVFAADTIPEDDAKAEQEFKTGVVTRGLQYIGIRDDNLVDRWLNNRGLNLTGEEKAEKVKEDALKERQKKIEAASGESTPENRMSHTGKLWKAITGGYRDAISTGDMDTIDQMRRDLEEYNSDVDGFETAVEREIKSSIKKQMGAGGNWSLCDSYREYLLGHGWTEQQISDEIIGKSDTAHQFQEALISGDVRAETHAYYLMLMAGVTDETIQDLYHNRWRRSGSVKSSGQFTWPVSGRLSTSHDATGMDFDVPSGTPVAAAEGGEVVFVGRNNSAGIYVDVKHPGGYITRYQHLSGYGVQVGQRVGKGDIIAKSGATGDSTKPHLKFTTFKGGTSASKAIDPIRFFQDYGADAQNYGADTRQNANSMVQ